MHTYAFMFKLCGILFLWRQSAAGTPVIFTLDDNGDIKSDTMQAIPTSGADQMSKFRQRRPKSDPISTKSNKTAGRARTLVFCGDRHEDEPFHDTMLGKRFKRQAVGNYVVETIIVLDYPLFLFWRGRNRNNNTVAKQEMVDYYANLIDSVNRRFDSVSSSDFSLRIAVNAFIIAENPLSSPWTQTLNVNNVVDAGKALDSFNAFLLSRKGVIRGIPYDHAFILSGFDLAINGKTSVVGIAQYRTCNIQSGSITEDLRSESTAGIIAHEVGHSLTSRHDGDKNRCNGGHNFIMGPNLRLPPRSRAANPWTFSSCSINYFRKFLVTPSAACTRKIAGKPLDLSPFLVEPFGQKYPPDVQCEIFLGTGSKFCRHLYDGDKRTIDDMCRTLYCDDPSSNFCYAIPAHDGTSCGNKKQKNIGFRVSEICPILIREVSGNWTFCEASVQVSGYQTLVGKYIRSVSVRFPSPGNLHWCQRGVCVASGKAPSTPEKCPAGDDPDVKCSSSSCSTSIFRDFLCCASCKPLVKETSDDSDSASVRMPTTASYFDTGRRVPTTPSLFPPNLIQ